MFFERRSAKFKSSALKCEYVAPFAFYPLQLISIKAGRR